MARTSIYKASNSGQVIGQKGTIAVPETPVAVTASAVTTAAFEGADPNSAGHPGDQISVSPRAALSGGIAIAQAWVSAANQISLKFINVGANASVAAQTMDVVLWNDVAGG